MARDGFYGIVLYLTDESGLARKRTGRPMTAEELERVLRRYPGDV